MGRNRSGFFVAAECASIAAGRHRMDKATTSDDNRGADTWRTPALQHGPGERMTDAVQSCRRMPCRDTAAPLCTARTGAP